jgi:chromosomal replication initiation ATPase DnaA
MKVSIISLAVINKNREIRRTKYDMFMDPEILDLFNSLKTYEDHKQKLKSIPFNNLELISFYDLDLEIFLKATGRHKEPITTIRHVLLYTVYSNRIKYNLTVKDIAALFFFKCHSTVIKNIQKMGAYIKYDPILKKLLKTLNIGTYE